MISLIIALSFIAVILYVVVNYNSVKPKIDRFYMQFGAAGKPMLYVSTVLALLVFGASLYMALEWAKGEEVPTFRDLGREGLSAAERYSDQLGELIETGVEDVEKEFEGGDSPLVPISRLTPSVPLQQSTTPVTGSSHMNFNAGAQQYMWGPSKYPDLYSPKIVNGDGTCQPIVKGYCSGDGRLLKHHSYAQTCNQVTVSPAMRFDSSIHAWSII